jgi:putative NADPH-quinone reductase
VFAAAVDALRAAGHQVATIDLYAEDFRAHMTAEEREAYHGDHPVLDPQVAAHIEQIRAAEALVFVYPTWWSSLPAILKGWLERTMVPGVGFVFHPRTHKVQPGLTHVRHIVGISTYGSGWRYVKLINDNGRRTLLRALRMSTGWRTRCHWLALYAMDTSTPAQRRAFLDTVATRMGSLR